jgi:hypothetical protein
VNERPETFERIVQSWDTANKATGLRDFSVCTTWASTARTSNEPRHHLPAQQAKRVHDLRLRDQAAAIQLGQYAVDAGLLLQRAQALADRFPACRLRSRSLSRKRPCRFFEKVEWSGTAPSSPSRQNQR